MYSTLCGLPDLMLFLAFSQREECTPRYVVYLAIGETVTQLSYDQKVPSAGMPIGKTIIILNFVCPFGLGFYYNVTLLQT